MNERNRIGLDVDPLTQTVPRGFLVSVQQLATAARSLAGGHPNAAYWMRCIEIVEAMVEVVREAAGQSQANMLAAATEARATDDAALLAIARLLGGLRKAEAALADIGDADREPGDDLAWCEKRAARALADVRAALVWYPSRCSSQTETASNLDVTIRAAYVAQFGSGSGWLSESGSYFIQGYRAAIAASRSTVDG